MMLSNEIVDAFHRDGYFYAGPVLSSEELEAARAAYDRIFKGERKPDSFRDLTLGDSKPSEATVQQVINMFELDSVFRAIVTKSAIIDIAEALLGASEIRLYHDQALYKPAFHGGEVPWHQDNGYWHLEPASAVSCWLTLDDVDQDNGCMWVIPGSHLRGDVEHAPASDTLRSLDVDDSTAVSLPMPAGCAMFHHCRTYHHTLANRTPRQRRAFAIHYMVAESVQNGVPLSDRLLVRSAAVA